ncbi:hypothetical protein [Actinoplanes sp. RD1]|uniref:hypothetical protein n=1 Tax=Actinoplanes sp. RD1 TaxID=3064538 RepID=UPI002741430E|nr:hypothetical protein [Actinoplanes sp. RD1]
MTEVPGGWGNTPPLPSSYPSPPSLPPRPVYREPHPIATGPLMAGIGAGALWFVLFGALAHSLATYAWWTVTAAVSAWLVSVFLALFGDRGVAVGVALTAGIGLSVAAGFVAADWIATGDWPLW